MVLKRTCLGVEILKTNSYLSFEACVVGALENRLIELVVLSTPNFCLGVIIFNTKSYLSLEACVVSAQNNRGAQWLSGRVLDSRPKGRGFEPHRRHCVVVLEQDTFILA